MRRQTGTLNRFRQLGASPVIFTTDGRTAATTADFARAGSGAGTSRASVGVKSPNTCGKSPLAMVSRRPS
jgi:hypothetical protein